MRIDARNNKDVALHWRCWDCAKLTYRHDVVWVDDGTQEYGLMNPDGSVWAVRSRVALVAVIKHAYINLDSDGMTDKDAQKCSKA